MEISRKGKRVPNERSHFFFFRSLFFQFLFAFDLEVAFGDFILFIDIIFIDIRRFDLTTE